MAVEKGYRDSRINRIFEGTNEINRLLVVDTAMKRAMKGDFDLFGEAGKITQDLDKLSDGNPVSGSDYYSEKLQVIKNFKKIALLIIQGASKQFDKKLGQEQEVLNNISDIISEVYISESLALRVQKLEALKGASAISLYKDILDVYVYDAAGMIAKQAHDAVYSFAAPEEAESCKSRGCLLGSKRINIKMPAGNSRQTDSGKPTSFDIHPTTNQQILMLGHLSASSSVSWHRQHLPPV
jgi:hypothetical protein